MKKQLYKYVYILIVFVGFATIGNSQGKHEFSVSAGGGLSWLNYNTDFGNASNKLGGFVGVGYGYYITNNLVIGIGAELSYYHSKINAGDFETVLYNLTDNESKQFDFYSQVKNYTEKQTAYFVNIPLMLQYQLDGFRKHKVYFSAGGKLGIPVNSKYKGLGGTITNIAYYPHLENWIGAPKFMGLGVFDNKGIDGDINLKMAVLISLETGIKWSLGRDVSLYTGAYLDYGLNDVVKDSRNRGFINYNHNQPSEFTNNSILNSSYTNSGQTQSFTDKVYPMAIGLKFKLAFGGSAARVKQPCETMPMVNVRDVD